MADEDHDLVARLRAGDEQAFVLLVARHHAAMLRIACSFVSSTAVAEEVVQDTWMGVLRGHRGVRRALVVQDLAMADPRQPSQDRRRA